MIAIQYHFSSPIFDKHMVSNKMTLISGYLAYLAIYLCKIESEVKSISQMCY